MLSCKLRQGSGEGQREGGTEGERKGCGEGGTGVRTEESNQIVALTL